jgi:hypothetical protein
MTRDSREIGEGHCSHLERNGEDRSALLPIFKTYLRLSTKRNINVFIITGNII